MYSIQEVYFSTVFSKKYLWAQHIKSKMSLEILMQHLFRKFSFPHHERKEKRNKCILHGTLKKKSKKAVVWKEIKGNPRQKKYVKLYSSPKTNSHFIYFLTVDTGGNRIMGQFTRLSLCSPVLISINYCGTKDFLQMHLSNHMFSLFCTLFQWPNSR